MESLSKPINAFTVDLEDWFQGLTSTNPLIEQWPSFESRVVQATKQLLAILHSHNVKATFFTLGHVADYHPSLIEQIHDEGHEIGVHGYFHRFVSRLTPEEFGEELARGIQAISRITGEYPLGHRAPYFSINARTTWAFDVMKSHGLQYDSSVFPVRGLLYGFPEAPRFPYQLHEHGLTEFPVSTIQLGKTNWPMGGGFYTRALPYPVIQWAVKRLNQQGQPAILYIHPWEIDVEQRYNQITVRERISHYHGRRNLARKLDRLFTDFQFEPLRNLLKTGVTST